MNDVGNGEGDAILNKVKYAALLSVLKLRHSVEEVNLV